MKNPLSLTENQVANVGVERPKRLKAKKSNPLPVSRKFYAGIVERIYNSYPKISEGVTLARETRECVDAYMLSGTVPQDSIDPRVKLGFVLLRPEIDKAMARSAAARNRHRKSSSEPSEEGKKPCAQRIKIENPADKLFHETCVALQREYMNFAALQRLVADPAGPFTLKAINSRHGSIGLYPHSSAGYSDDTGPKA